MYELSPGDLVVVPFGNIPDRPTKARVGVVTGEPYDYGESGENVVEVEVFVEGPFSMVVVSVHDAIPLTDNLDLAAAFGLSDKDLFTLHELAHAHRTALCRVSELQRQLSSKCHKTPYLLWSDVRCMRKEVKDAR